MYVSVVSSGSIEHRSVESTRFLIVRKRFVRRPYDAARNVAFADASLDARKRLANIEAQGGVEGERAIVKCGLHQTHSGGMALIGSIHDGLHEFAADAEVLRSGIHSNGANASDQGALVETITSNDATSAFGHHAVEVRTGEHRREHAGGDFGSGKIGRETVLRADVAESVVADLAANGAIGRSSGTDCYFRLCFRLHRSNLR